MFGSGYLLLILACTVIGMAASGYVNRQINKYSKVPTTMGITGAQAAANMLAYHGVSGVPIKRGGSGQDFFDPKSNSITIDPQAYGQASVTAFATACHEVGHACQYAKGYTPMKIRSALVPVVNLATNSWMIVLVLGIAMNLAGLVDLAIVLFSFAVLFELVTLPVEFDASRRAMDYMETIGMAEGERVGAYKVLRACALTYVAAALVSILQLLYLLGQRNR